MFLTGNVLLMLGLLVFAYLMGSIPTALIIGKSAKKIDIREHGSGNLGATNAVRVLGIRLGLAIFFSDMFKAFLPALIARLLTGNINFALIVGLVAVLGHCYPIFAGFKGGKGIASGVGMFFAISPLAAALGLITFGLSLLLGKMVSLASMLGALSVPIVTTIAYPNEYGVILLSWVLFIFVIFKHIPNIKKIIKGTERKVIFWKKKKGKNE